MVQRYGFFLNSQNFFDFFTLLADRSRGVCIFYFDLRSGSGAALVVVACVPVFAGAPDLVLVVALVAVFRLRLHPVLFC